MKCSITTTATCRPDILDRTYSSFCKHVHGLADCSLYLNIDPVPSQMKAQVNDVIDVAKKYFHEVVWNFPKKPNFTKSVEWLWGQANSDYIFHLEDDWEITEDVSLDSLIDLFKSNSHLLQVRLAHKLSSGCPFGLSPSIISRRFYKHFVGKFKSALNPEGQLKKFPERATANKTTQRYPSDRVVIYDIGRTWRRDNDVIWSDVNGKKIRKNVEAMERFVKW